VLRYKDLGTDYRLVPDATITSAVKRVRLFVELDRSNKGLSRIKENLECYNTFNRHVHGSVYKDGKEPWVVYIVRSRARHDSVAKLASDVLKCRWKVAIAGQAATQWLAAQLLDEQRANPPALTPAEADALLAATADLRSTRAAVLRAAEDLRRSSTDLLERNPNAFRELGQVDSENVARWRKDLRAVQDLVRGLKHAG
jgi:hypothetical protein